MFADTHAHLTMPEYSDLPEVLDRSLAAGLQFIIDVGFDIESSEMSTVLSQEYDYIYSAVGIHPHDAKSFDEECFKKLDQLLAFDKVVALGEIGLDYHYSLSTREEQKRVFSKLLWAANQHKKPVIFHGRESYHDMKDIIMSEGHDSIKGVFHSYSGDPEMLNWILDKGFYISISGMITFKNGQNIKDIAKAAPIDRILIETDCPYLTPEPYRGKRNEPSYVKFVAEELARVKGLRVEEVAEVTTRNAKTLFNIK